jgi:hypothetical protein
MGRRFESCRAHQKFNKLQGREIADSDFLPKFPHKAGSTIISIWGSTGGSEQTLGRGASAYLPSVPTF